MKPDDLVNTLIEEVFNNGKLSILEDIIHSNYHFSSTDSELNGIDELKDFIQSFRTAFPDLNLCIDDIFTSGTKTCTSFTFTGTHEEDFMGIPPTKQAVKVQGVVISTIQDSKIIEEREILDNLGFFQQLGVIPDLS